MNIQKVTLFLLIVIVTGLMYFIGLANRLSSDLYVMTLNYVLLATALLIGNARYQRLVNPITLLTPLMLAYVYYSVMMSDRQEQLISEVEISYYIFVCSFILGCMMPFYPRKLHNVDSPTYRLRVCDFLLLIGLIVFFVEVILSGGFPLLTLIIYQVDSYANMVLIPIAHYFVMTTALLPALYYYSYKAEIISRRRFIFCCALVAFILLNTLSRQLMILTVIAFYFSYSKLNKINEIRFIAIILVISIALFLGMGEIRIGAINSSVSTLDYIKAYSDVPITSHANTFEVTFNLYAAMNFNTFNTIAREASSFFFGAYTFRPILDITHASTLLEIGIPDSRDTFKMLATIIADPYLDFGLPGVFFFGLSYGIFGSYAYSTYISRENAAYTLLWATFTYVMVMAVFTNFFNVFFIWLCIGLCWLIFTQPGRN